MEGKMAYKTTTRIMKLKDGTEKELVIEEDKLIDIWFKKYHFLTNSYF